MTTRSQLEPRTVYFIRPIGMMGPIKIGCSKSPEGRKDTLETWSPFPLEIVAKIDGNFLLERRFHALFASNHQRREWFDWSPHIEAVIGQIVAGSFDTSTLPEPVGIAGRINNVPRKRSPEECRQLSYSLRESHLSRKSGWQCPVKVSDIVNRGNADEIATLEQYLADPASNGIAIDWPWAVQRRAAYQPRRAKLARAA